MSIPTKTKGKMKCQFDKELAHMTASLVLSPMDQVSNTKIGHVDMIDFLQRIQSPANKEMKHVKRSNTHLVSSFPMVSLEPKFILGCA